MSRRRYAGHRRGKADGGSAWISYSDMMAALLLVFVLVLCYSVYQYFLMLETKTAELDEQSALLGVQQSTLEAQRVVLDEQESTLNAQRQQLEEQRLTLAAQQAKLDQQQEELATQQSALLIKEDELNGALTQLEEQQGLLSTQALTLAEQEKLIIAAEIALQAKEAELNAANFELETKQLELANATILLGEQQYAMDQQQKRLDDLVGVRTQIVRELTDALAAADLKAGVDPNTGDICLRVLFSLTWEKTPSRRAEENFLSVLFLFIWAFCFKINILIILAKSLLRATPIRREPIWSIWSSRRNAP